MPTPVTNFRLGSEVLEALDAIAAKDNDSRTGVIRRLILDEHARAGLGREAADAFVEQLVNRFGVEAQMRFETTVAGEVALKVDSEIVTDLLTLGVVDVGNVAFIYLGDPGSTVRLNVGSVPAFGGAIEVPISALRAVPLGWETL